MTWIKDIEKRARNSKKHFGDYAGRIKKIFASLPLALCVKKLQYCQQLQAAHHLRVAPYQQKKKDYMTLIVKDLLSALNELRESSIIMTSSKLPSAADIERYNTALQWAKRVIVLTEGELSSRLI